MHVSIRDAVAHDAFADVLNNILRNVAPHLENLGASYYSDALYDAATLMANPNKAHFLAVTPVGTHLADTVEELDRMKRVGGFTEKARFRVVYDDRLQRLSAIRL